MKAERLAAAALCACTFGALASDLSPEAMKAFVLRAGSPYVDGENCFDLTLQGMRNRHWGIDDELFARCQIQLIEYTYGRGDPRIAAPLFRLGQAYRSQARLQEAAVELERSVKIRESAFGREDPGLRTTVEFLGWTYRDLGRFENAERVLRRALALTEKEPGAPRWAVGMASHQLALALLPQGRFEDAQPLEERAISLGAPEGFGDALGAYRNGLALALLGQGRLDAAAREVERGLKGMPDSGLPAARARREELERTRAAVREMARQRADAETAGREAINLARLWVLPAGGARQGPGPETRALRGGDCDYFDGMLQVVERFHGREDHPALVAPLYLAGYCWEQGGRADEAQAHFRRALAIRGNRHRP